MLGKGKGLVSCTIEVLSNATLGHGPLNSPRCRDKQDHGQSKNAKNVKNEKNAKNVKHVKDQKNNYCEECATYQALGNPLTHESVNP